MIDRAKPLTPEQKRTICENRERFPADIARMPGMDGTTTRQISDYLRLHPAGEPNPHAELADHLEEYIRQFGLPSKYGNVMAYVRYIRAQS